MVKEIELKIKQNFTDKETKVDYKKGKTYKFSEKRAEELLKNSYIVEKTTQQIENNKNSKEETQNKTETIK